MGRPTLAGVRVLELGLYLAAPFAAHVLGQLGAEVIKIESPLGDPTRNVVKGGAGGTFISYSVGKRSLGLNLQTSEGQQVFERLVASADVLVHNLAPDSATKLRITAAACHRVNPDLIHCQIRGYGPGPRTNELASNPIVEAMTGVMFGHRVDGRPTRMGPSYHDMFAGMYAALGVMSELYAPKRIERSVEIGLYEAGLHVAARDLVGEQQAAFATDPPSEARSGGEFHLPGYAAYETADGRWIYLVMLSDDHWHRFCLALHLPEAHDRALVTLVQRERAGERVEKVVSGAVGALRFDELAAQLASAGVGFAEVTPYGRVLDDVQARQPGKVSRVHFRDHDFLVPRFPILAETATQEEPTDPPRLGQDTVEVLRSLGYDAEVCERLLADRVAFVT